MLSKAARSKALHQGRVRVTPAQALQRANDFAGRKLPTMR